MFTTTLQTGVPAKTNRLFNKDRTLLAASVLALLAACDAGTSIPAASSGADARAQLPGSVQRAALLGDSSAGSTGPALQIATLPTIDSTS